MASEKISTPFEVRIPLEYGESLVFGNCRIVEERDNGDITELVWSSDDRHVEYLPYWRWFWEEIFDLDTLVHEEDKSCIIEVNGIKIPVKDLKYSVVGGEIERSGRFYIL